VITFVRVSLALLAVFTVAGLAAPFALAAKARQPVLAVTALVIGAWALVALIAGAVIV
jgi:hypothetical protein